MLLHPDPCQRGYLDTSGPGHPEDLLGHQFFTRGGYCPKKLPASAATQPPKFPLENVYPSNSSLTTDNSRCAH